MPILAPKFKLVPTISSQFFLVKPSHGDIHSEIRIKKDSDFGIKQRGKK